MSDGTELKLGRVAPMVPVTDIERAERFYCELFGLERTFQNGDPVGFMILKKDQAEVHLTLVRDHKPRVFNVMHMMVSDAAIVYERCQKLGVRIIKDVRDAPWGLRTFVFADPDGNRIDLGSRLETER